MVYLVDYENVGYSGLEGIASLEPQDTVIIFYNKKQTMPMSVHIKFTNIKCEVIYFQVTASTANALDFQLSTYLGFLTTLNNDFCIISKDGGYDAVIKFWQKRKIKIKRTPSICSTPAPCKIKFEFENINKKAYAKIFIDDLIGEEYTEISDEILKIVTENETRDQIYKAILRNCAKTTCANGKNMI